MSKWKLTENGFRRRSKALGGVTLSVTRARSAHWYGTASDGRLLIDQEGALIWRGTPEAIMAALRSLEVRGYRLGYPGGGER